MVAVASAFSAFGVEEVQIDLASREDPAELVEVKLAIAVQIRLPPTPNEQREKKSSPLVE